MDLAHDQLIRAAIEDDLQALAGADSALVNVADDTGKTALFYALFRSGATTDDDPKTIEALLAVGADPNQPIRRKNGELRSPLHQAAIRSLGRVGRSLVAAGASTDEAGLLHAAAEGGQHWLVERCLEHTPVNALHHGVTPMHDACYSGSESVVRLMFDRGADVHLPVQSGDWAGLDNLHFAIIGNNAAVVRLVLGEGVRTTPEHLAFLLDSERPWAAPPEEVEDAVALLQGDDAEPQAEGAPLSTIAALLRAELGEQAARSVAGSVGIVETPRAPVATIDADPDDVAARLASGELPSELGWRRALHAAALTDRADLLRAFAEHVDVNLSCTGPVAMPPLCAAARAGNLAAVRALMECGADVRRKGADNKNAYYAARDREIRALLRAFGPVW